MAVLTSWEKIQEREKNKRANPDSIQPVAQSPWEKIQEREKIKSTPVQAQAAPLQNETFTSAIKKPGTFVKDIAKGVLDVGTEDIPIAGGIQTGVKSALVLKSLNSVERGVGTKQDLQRLREYQAELDTEAKKNLSSGYRIGSGIKSSIVFGSEIALALAGAAALPFSGGASAAAPAGTAASIAGKKAAVELVEKTAKKRITDALINNAKKIGFATVFTAPSHVPADTIQRMIGDYSITPEEKLIINTKGQPVSEALTNAVSSHIVNVGGEIAFGKVLDSLGAGAKEQLFKAAFLKEFARKNKVVPQGFASKLLEKANINSILGEMGEEELQNLTNGVLAEMGLGDQKYKMPTANDLAERLVTFGGIRMAAGVVDRVIREDTKEKIDKLPPEELETRYEKLESSARARIESGVSPVAVAAEMNKQLSIPLNDADLVVEKIVKDIAKEKKMAISEAVAKDDIENQQIDKFAELTQPVVTPEAAPEPAVVPEPVITPEAPATFPPVKSQEPAAITPTVTTPETIKPATPEPVKQTTVAEKIIQKKGQSALIERFKRSKVKSIAEGFNESDGQYDIKTDKGQLAALNKILAEDKDPIERLTKIIEAGKDVETGLDAGIVLQEINNSRINVPITEKLLAAIKSFSKKATEAGQSISALRNVEKHNFSKQVDILQKIKTERFARSKGKNSRNQEKSTEAVNEIIEKKVKEVKEKTKKKTGQKKVKSEAWEKLIKQLQC